VDGERSRAEQRRVEQGRAERGKAEKDRARQNRADQIIRTIILRRWVVLACMILCVHMPCACACNINFIPSSSHHRRPACMLPRHLSLRACRSIAPLGASNPASQIFSRIEKIEKLIPHCSAHSACKSGEEGCNRGRATKERRGVRGMRKGGERIDET